jgi:hypothetical protein
LTLWHKINAFHLDEVDQQVDDLRARELEHTVDQLQL